MKTNLFLIAALLLSTASFAQDANAQGSVTAASSASVSTDAVATTAKTAKHASQKTAAAVSTEKSTASAAATTSTRETKETVKSTSKEHVSVNAAGAVNTSAANNKPGQDASLNGQAAVSAKSAQQSTTVPVNQTRAAVKTTGTETVTVAGKAKTAAVKTATKPRPVAVKMHTQVKANGGIKIK